MTNDFVQISDFFAQVDWNSKIYLLLRHAERNHITPDDKDFGAHVGLTDCGRRQAVALGKMIPAIGDAVYFSSPVGRCMETFAQAPRSMLRRSMNLEISLSVMCLHTSRLCEKVFTKVSASGLIPASTMLFSHCMNAPNRCAR